MAKQWNELTVNEQERIIEAINWLIDINEQCKNIECRYYGSLEKNDCAEGHRCLNYAIYTIGDAIDSIEKFIAEILEIEYDQMDDLLEFAWGWNSCGGYQGGTVEECFKESLAEWHKDNVKAKTYKVEVKRTASTYIEVEANSEEEASTKAMTIARNTDFSGFEADYFVDDIYQD